jgi:hypothetical protein
MVRASSLDGIRVPSNKATARHLCVMPSLPSHEAFHAAPSCRKDRYRLNVVSVTTFATVLGELGMGPAILDLKGGFILGHSNVVCMSMLGHVISQSRASLTDFSAFPFIVCLTYPFFPFGQHALCPLRYFPFFLGER